MFGTTIRALYDRTYQVLYDAGVNEKLADELATQRTLAVALMSREQPFPDFVRRSVGPRHLRSFNTPTTQHDCCKQLLDEQSSVNR